ncbi:amino acid adenylation domain-containing protein [Streptomyces sp. NBC_01092]|uniref:amino acid adenylation domain-containing protein n=1 Tax=Streptomyces sp. NBC_01092 TaxID=2903748 RepID=UPI0038677681|nr:amino acid adenylation domain-containing protein [Streptomyces sp. NBC_01092]
MTTNRGAVLPLTAAQAEIWFDEQFATGPLGYNMADYIDLRGPLDPDLLGRALGRLGHEAEGLRVQFVDEDGTPGQIIRPLAQLPLKRLDFDDEPQPLAAAEAWMRADHAEPLKVTDFPLFRGALIRLGPEHHLLYLCMHHILADGFSRALLYPKLAALYTRLAAGEDERALDADAMPPFHRLLDAERDYLDSGHVERDRAHWTARLTAGAHGPAPELVSLSARQPAPGRSALRHTARLSVEATDALRALARDGKVTMPVVLVAAAAAYTQRATGVDRPLLTLPVTGRVGAASREIPGMLANYLPLAVPVRPDTTRTQLLRRAWIEVSGALKHQRYRGDRIRRDIGLRTDDRRPFGPFINVLNQDPALAFADACDGTVVNLSTGIVNDLIITVLNTADGTMEIHLDGNPELYTSAELATHLARFEAFLTSLAALPADHPVGRIGLGAPGEPRGLLGTWDRDAERATYEGLVECVRAVAATSPDAVAVSDGTETLTYRELLTRAAGVAARLHASGMEPGAVVAMLADPGVPFVAGVLGVLGAGGAYLPLDPAAPAARNAGLLQDSGARHLLTGAAYGTPAPNVTALPLTEPTDATCATELPAIGDGLDLAYVMFTSGSTGRPKGAMVQRSGMVNHLWAKVGDLDLVAGEAVVQNAPLTFDVSVWQMLAPLLVGGRVRVSGTEMAADPAGLFGMVREERVAVLEVVPSLLRAALDAWDVEGRAPELPYLRWLMVTGEALPADLCERWHARYPQVPLMNAYGPTECSDDVTHAVIRAGDDLGGRVPIGGAVRNTRLYVLSDELQPVPVGVPGELYVGGAGVGRGYLHDPSRTAGTFMADPFGPSGSRMYRTGDRVIQRPDGQLEFIERRDHQVKIRGRRVETGEIEAVIRSLESVVDAAVAVLPDASGNPRLVGYLTGPGVDAGQVRDELAQLLPAYMIPSSWLVLDAMPLTPNGKLDRKALPQPALSGQEAVRGPRTERERVLCGIYADVLGTRDVGVDEDFFALGGDSIRSIQVVSRARKAGLALTTRDVFDHKTVAALARAAAALDVDPAGEPESDEGVGPYELTPIMGQLHEDTRSLTGPVVKYSQHVVVHVPAGLDADLLDAALHTLVDHHDALRTRATEPAPGLWQTEVLERGALAGVRLVASADAGGARGKELLAFAERQAAAARARLDPGAAVMLQAVLIPAPGLAAAEPTFRGAGNCATSPHRPAADNAPELAQPGTDTALLVLCGHHLVVDGVSWRILLPDLAAACAALAEGRTPAPDPVGTSYRAWSRLLAEQARTEVRGAELALWQRILDGPDPLVGTRRLDLAKDVYGTRRTLRLELGPEVTAPLLTDVPAAFHAEVNDVLLTGLALAVADWRRRHGHTHFAQTLIELEGHGREQLADGLDLSRTVGWFTSAFPLRLDPGALDWDEVWAGGPALAAALKRVKEQLRALPDRGVGHGLLRYLNPHAARVLAPYRRPQLGFNYMGRFDAREDRLWEPAGGDGVVGTGAHPAMPLPHLLDVTPATEDRHDGPHLIANWAWAGQAVAEDDAQDIAETWFRALELLVRHTATPGAGGRTPSDLPLVDLTQDEIEAYEAELAGAGTTLTDVLPLTPLQQGLLFHADYDQDATDVYTLQIVAELEGDIDPAVLRAAGQALLDRHPNLRAAFRARATGDPVQLVPDHAELPWQETDLRDLPEPQRTAELDRITEAERTRRFDLTAPPLLRFALVTHGEGRHRFVWTSHHILVDGWSMPLLVRELFALCRTDADATLLPDPAPYRAYLGWLAGQDREAARAAWRTALDGVDEPTLLVPADPDRAPVLPEAVRAEVPRELTAALSGWARARGLTLNTVVQGCWALLLGRLTGRQDVVFGAVTSGRPAEVPDVESMIGMFLTTVPVRVRLHPDATLTELLHTVQDRQTALMPHEHLGLAEIHKAAGLAGEVFDTVVLFENFPLDAAGPDQGADGTRVLRTEARDARHHPLSLAVFPGDALTLRLDYAPDQFTRADVERVALMFRHLLHTVADTPALPLARIDVTAPATLAGSGTPGELGGLLGTWDPSIPEESLGVVERVRAVADRIPDEPAVTDGTTSRTYRELVETAGGLSVRLTAAGMTTGSVIAMLADPGVPFVTGVLGVLGAGGAYLPLDPAAPAARNAGLLRDSGAGYLLVGTAYEAQAREIAGDVTVVVLEDALTDRAVPPTVGGGLDLAYVMFTSGSTGRPKGAMVQRSGMVNHLWAKVGDLDLAAGEVVVQNAPLTFDVSVWQMLAPLLVGGRVRVSGTEMAADPAGLFAMVREERMAVLEVVPSLLRAALDAWDVEGRAPELPDLRWLMVTGEALPADLCERWHARYPQVPLMNAYGPTECSDDVTHAVIRAGDDLGGRVPIGGAVRNTRLYVLSDELQPVPVGVPGELYVGGAGVGRGYLDDPARTAGTFMADPFAGPGTRMYRTGDRVIQRPDGQLEFIERRDHQVKIRGRRVELGEIEAAVRGLDQVTDAAVAVVPDASGNPRLVGYLTGPGVDAGQVRDELAQLLPAYMIPATWLVLDAMPLTPNGKLDRKALPLPERTDETQQARAPRDEREEILCGILAEVLGMPAVGIDEDFFALGGDSIRSIQVVSRARTAGLALTTRDVFTHRSAAALARAAGAVGAEPAPEPEGDLIELTDEELADLEFELSEDLS